MMTSTSPAFTVCTTDLDLYTRRGGRPHDTVYDCRPYTFESDESCTHADPGADWWYMLVRLHSGADTAYTIGATYS